METSNHATFWESTQIFGLDYCLTFVASYIETEMDIHLFSQKTENGFSRETDTFASRNISRENLSQSCLDIIFDDCGQFIVDKSSLLNYCGAFGFDAAKAGCSFSLGRNERPNPFEFSFPEDMIHVVELSAFMYGKTFYYEQDGEIFVR